MKRWGMLLVMGLLVLGLAAPARSDSITYSGAWVPNDNDVNEIRLDLFVGESVDFSLYIYMIITILIIIY